MVNNFQWCLSLLSPSVCSYIQGSSVVIDGRWSTIIFCWQMFTYDDRCDMSKRNSFCGKVNNVLVYFIKCDLLVKLKLLRIYCNDFYGSVVWDMSHSCIDDVCVAWRKGLRRALSLPSRTHCALLPRVTGMLPLRDELLCRTARFITSCLNCENIVV